jgi:hypothetical protein
MQPRPDQAEALTPSRAVGPRGCGLNETTRRLTNSAAPPNSIRVYAVALHSAGRLGEATTVLKENLARHPDDRDTLSALITYSLSMNLEQSRLRK